MARWRCWETAYQKSSAEPRKERCWHAWTKSLVRVAWKRVGRCQSQRTAAWISQETTGVEIAVQGTEMAGWLEAAARRLDQLPGRAWRVAMRGLPKTRSGAATSMRSSC